MTSPIKNNDNPIDPVVTPPPPPPKKEETSWKGHAVIVIGVAATAAAVLFFAWELTLYVKTIASERFSRINIDAAEDKIRAKGLGDLLEKVKKIKTLDSERVIKRMALCTDHEKEILSSLQDRFHFNDEQLKEMLMGAHVFLDDSGETCKKWMEIRDGKNQPVAVTGISSHPSDGEQFRLRGSLVSELLFSTITDKESGKTYTWFQLENHPLTIGHITLHMVDFVKYWISKFNQGPYGSSSYTHNCPMCIPQKTAAVE